MTENEYERYVAEFDKEQKGVELQRFERATAQREAFLLKYPLNALGTLPMKDYLFAKAGYGSGDTFCNWMFSGLNEIAHTGDLRTDMYGIYYRNGTELALSRTFKNRFGNDFEAAYVEIRLQIVNLLDTVAHDAFDEVEKCELARPFRYKILAVYFPDKFLPICVSGLMEEAREAMELPVPTGREMVFDNIELRRLKESHASTRDWDNETFLGFCRWVGRQKGTVLSATERRQRAVERAVKIEEEIKQSALEGEEKEAVVKIRVNQDVFRDELLKRYPTCALCKVDNPQLLVASHIKPWSASETEEKLDVDNGFILCPNHDKLFDRGLISFDDEGRILISEELSDINQIFTNITSDMKIVLTDGQRKYLKYHRDNIFVG